MAHKSRRKSGPRPGRPFKPMTDATFAIVRAMAQAGLIRREAARLTGFSYTTLARRLNERGTTFAELGAATPHAVRTTVRRHLELVASQP